MTYDARESSRELGNPVELFLFELGSTRYGYTNGEDNITRSAIDYVATPIERSKVSATIESKDDNVSITVPGSNAFARLFIGVIPGDLPQVTIRQLHRDDPDDEDILIFEGTVASLGFSDDLQKVKMACSPITSANALRIPRHTFQGLCNHFIYDDRCTILETDHEETGTVSSVSGRDVTITGVSNLSGTEFWTNGFIELGSERRTIFAQNNDVMTLDLPFAVDPTGTSVRILPGCDHLIDGDCLNTFGTGPTGNTVNHSGYPAVPTKNPFEGLD